MTAAVLDTPPEPTAATPSPRRALRLAIQWLVWLLLLAAAIAALLLARRYGDILLKQAEAAALLTRASEAFARADTLESQRALLQAIKLHPRSADTILRQFQNQLLLMPGVLDALDALYPPGATSDLDGQDALNYAILLILNGQELQALEQLAAAERAPAEAQFLAAQLWLARGQHDRAGSLFQEYWGDSKKRRKTQMQRIVAQLDNPEQRQDANSVTAVARALYESGLWVELRHFLEVGAAPYHNAELHFLRGFLSEIDGNQRAAVTNYKKALQEAPTHRDSRVALRRFEY